MIEANAILEPFLESSEDGLKGYKSRHNGEKLVK